jgi:hypothetical protein
MRRERGQMQRPNRSEFGAAHRLPLVGPEAAKPGSHLSRNLKIRSPPVDDVNNLGHDSKCQRCFASTAIQIRRNALFTSPEYARNPPLVQRIGAWLFGLTYFGLGLGLIEVGRETRSLGMAIFGLAFAFAGVVVFRNGFGKRRSKEKGLRG